MNEHAMNHGPFYRSAELVASVHRAEGGRFDGFRAARAVGRFYAGTFTATPAAKTLVSFTPSLSALRWIGNLAETSSIEQKER